MSTTSTLTAPLVDEVEARRVQESDRRDASQRGSLGQYFTPAPIAKLLAGMFEVPRGDVRVLDPGAGVGSLTAALVDRAHTEGWPVALDITAVEVDQSLITTLEETLRACGELPVTASTNLSNRDFIEWACDKLGASLFATNAETFDLAILNPPYHKLRSSSRERRLLSSVGIEVSNLYAAFVALALRLLAPGGQLVAITPRSFCNGPYFTQFRKELLRSAALRQIHVFDARDKAFSDTSVLQENVVFHVAKSGERVPVAIGASDGDGATSARSRVVPYEQVVHPEDLNYFIHLVPDGAEADVARRIGSLPNDLESAGAGVSTGKVVDFRARDYLRKEAEPGTVPLIYPTHLREGRVRWPVANSKKANALVDIAETQKLLLPSGNYVLVKRFSSKEERRRIVASVLEADDLDSTRIAVENHVNVFHHYKGGLPLDLAWGLASFLNSTIVDVFFRQFNGHTQVNATDLRSLRYPTQDQLLALGARARTVDHDQNSIDSLVEEFVPALART